MDGEDDGEEEFMVANRGGANRGGGIQTRFVLAMGGASGRIASFCRYSTILMLSQEHR